MPKRKLDAQEEMHSILINDRIHFKPNSTNVVEESEPALDKIAQILHDNPDINVHVEGHVAVPSDAETQRNAPGRKAVCGTCRVYCKRIISRGIEVCRLSPVGFGGTRPLPAGQNSRVEINVDGLNTNSTNAKQVSTEEMVALQGAKREPLAERQQRRRLVQESLEHLMEEEPVVFQSPVAKKISNESAHTMSKVAAVLNHDEDVRVRIENRVPIIPLRDFRR